MVLLTLQCIGFLLGQSTRLVVRASGPLGQGEVALVSVVRHLVFSTNPDSCYNQLQKANVCSSKGWRPDDRRDWAPLLNSSPPGHHD